MRLLEILGLRKKAFKPSLEACMALLWKIAQAMMHPYVLKEEEVETARFMERLGLVKVLDDEEPVSHKKRLIAVSRCQFNCEECSNFQGYKIHEWKSSRGELQRYANPLPKCKEFGFLVSGTSARGRRCGKFVPKLLMEAFS